MIERITMPLYLREYKQFFRWLQMNDASTVNLKLKYLFMLRIMMIIMMEIVAMTVWRMKIQDQATQFSQHLQYPIYQFKRGLKKAW